MLLPIVNRFLAIYGKSFGYLLYFIPRQTNHPLDIVQFHIGGILENRDVEPLWSANREYLGKWAQSVRLIDHPIHQDVITSQKGALHRAGGYLKRLNNECSEKKGKEYRYRHNLDVFYQSLGHWSHQFAPGNDFGAFVFSQIMVPSFGEPHRS